MRFELLSEADQVRIKRRQHVDGEEAKVAAIRSSRNCASSACG